MPNQWLKPVLTYKYPTLALPSYLIIYWLRQERFYDRQHNALMWATRVSNSLLPRLCWCMLIFLGPSSQQAARLQRDPGGRMHCTHGASHDPRVSLFFVHVVCSVKFDRPNQATTNDKSVGQLGTPSFDQLVQFI